MSIITPVNYTPHEWKNAGAEGAFPLNAERANEIEKGIIDAAEAANKLIISTGDLANDMSLLDNGLQAGRSIADIPEIQDELDDAGSVAQFLLARATARDAKFLRIGDYVDIAHSGIGSRRYRIGTFWAYYNCSDQPLSGHIGMVPDEVWPNNPQWNPTNDNNGTAAQPHPYLNSNLHKFELQTILPTFPAEWQSVMKNYRTLLETRYSASGKLSSSTGWAWADLGKVFSLSETEVYGQCVWGTPGYSVGMDCQWPIFAQTRNRIKTKAGSRAYWWLRSVHGSSSAHACNVSGGGYAGHGSASHTGISALPCFLVGA